MNLNIAHFLKRFFATVLFAFLAVMTANARPARPSVSIVSQPDGSAFTLISYGDEFHKVCRTSDGYAVTRDGNGWWCYEILDSEGKRCSSGFPAGSKAPADILSQSRGISTASASGKRQAFDRIQEDKGSIMKRLRGDGMTKAEGGSTVTKHGIVLLVSFKDVKFKYTREDFLNMLTKPGYSTGGATGSAKEYFESQFGEGYEFNFDVCDVVTVGHDRSYYGSNDSGGSDSAPEQMVIEACKLADTNVDFSLYDQDGDGEVDNVFVFFAGEDEADTQNADCIWSHAWYIKDGANVDLFQDGVRINRYACASELMPASGNTMTLTGIGTFCHEYSHTLGLMDYYDTDYEQSGGMSGSMWTYTALMDGGNMNNNGNTPPYFNAVDREVMGISEPVKINGNGTYTMAPVGKGGTVYRLDTDNADEYYLFECREASGWDKYINGNGMLVYHIDKSGKSEIWSDKFGRNLSASDRWLYYNEINTSAEHQCADLIEADGRTDRFSNWESYSRVLLSKGTAGIFYPSSSVNSIEPSRLKFWSGKEHTVTISDITKTDGSISFFVGGFGGEVPPEAVIDKKTIFQDAAIIQFSANIAGSEAEATVQWGKTQEEKTEVRVKPYSPGKYALVIEGLTPSTNYDVRISFSLGGMTGKETSTSFLTARYQKGSYPYISFKGAERNSDGTFLSSDALPLRVWNATDAAEIKWYFDGRAVAPGGNGTFCPGRNGELKAVITWEDGSEDIILKEITIADNDEE